MIDAWRMVAAAVRRFNVLMGYVSALSIVACTLILVYEVLTRYLIKVSNDWVIELSVFLLIASTFLAAAYTQAQRGHVGIEVLGQLLSARANRWRFLLADILSMLVCAYIAYRAWLYCDRAWQGDWTTSSTWAPKLWIPYFFMAFGMTTLVMQQLIQIVDRCLAPPPERARRGP